MLCKALNTKIKTRNFTKLLYKSKATHVNNANSKKSLQTKTNSQKLTLDQTMPVLPSDRSRSYAERCRSREHDCTLHNKDRKALYQQSGHAYPQNQVRILQFTSQFNYLSHGTLTNLRNSLSKRQDLEQHILLLVMSITITRDAANHS